MASDPKALTARDIVLEYLDAHGYDGLYEPGECGCLKDDLAPCGNILNDCLPGYRTECPPGGEYDFVVGPKPEVPNG